jgi:hypothetical protein
MREESLIRDKLAAKLSIIEIGLSLIQKEYPLPNNIGSKGFIDILATDIYENYVIIELKRSKATSRDAFQEIPKYVGLIKQNFKARDSELRVIIVSTDWQELFIPFCEFKYESTLHIKGYRLLLDVNKTILGVGEVIPETIAPIRRELAHTYSIALFRRKEDRDSYLLQLATISQIIGRKDIVITCISTKASEKCIYPFGTCYSFNKLSKNEYLSLSAIRQKLDMEEEEFENESEFLSYLEQCVLCAIHSCNNNYDSLEVGSPEKLQGVLQVEGWNIDSIHRYGFFKTDPRLTDELLIKELQGYRGNSKHLYSNFVESAHKDRLKEIVENAGGPFKWNIQWEIRLKNLFQFIQKKDKPFRMVVHVYSPESIFQGIYHFLKSKQIEYLPMYLVFVDYYTIDEIQIFKGSLLWNGKKINESSYKSFVTRQNDALISKQADICMGFFDNEILNYFNLKFKIKRTIQKRGEKGSSRYVYLDNNADLQTDSSPSYSLTNWVANHLQFCWGIIKMYESNVFDTRFSE